MTTTCHKLTNGTKTFEFYPHDRYEVSVERMTGTKATGVYGRMPTEKAREWWTGLVKRGYRVVK